MSYTPQTLAYDAFERIKVSNPQAPASLIPRLTTMIPSALERLARVAVENDYEGLQKSFAITIAAGETDLASIAGLLFNPLRSIVYPSASSTPAIYLEEVEDLIWGIPDTGASVPVYYSQKGTILSFRNNTDGLLTTLAGTGSLVTNYVPSLTDAAYPLPVQYEGLTVETLVEMSMGKLMTQELAAAGRA